MISDLASKQSEFPNSVPRRISAIILAAAVTLVSGCSGGSPTSVAVDSAKAADEGVRAIEARDWAKAETQFTSALDSKTLSGDRYEEVLLGRARARFEKGDLDRANEDIQTLEKGAAAMDQVLLLKAEIQLKKGDAAAAKATFQQAKQINGTLVAPAGL